MSVGFFSTTLEKWLLDNLNNSLLMPTRDTCWDAMFGVIARRIWKCHNNFIFKSQSCEATVVIAESLAYSKAVSDAMQLSTREPRQMKASPRSISPPSDWLKLNTDGAVSFN